MIKVCFLGPLSALGECEYNCANLSELKETLSKDERLEGWLKDCAISLNDEIITDLNTPLRTAILFLYCPQFAADRQKARI